MLSWMLSVCVVAMVGSSVLPQDVERLQASVGGFAVMNCHLDFPFGNEIPYQLQWDKDGEVILSWFSGDESPRVLARFEGRVWRLSEGRGGLGRGSINVTGVRDTDAGLYRCRVTFPNRTPPARNNGTFYYLDVDGSNLIVTPPLNSTVLENERTELECLPKLPDHTVQWFKDGSVVTDVPELANRAVVADNGSLVILQAAITDPGEYECRVTSPDGTVQTAAAYLDVQYKARVVYAPAEQYLAFGSSASLDCHFSANPPLTNLRWEKDGFLFDPYNVQGVFYSRNGSLLFNHVEESHEGSYSCTPYNALGTGGASPAMVVRVVRPPAFAAAPRPVYLARLGSALTLPCALAPTPHTSTLHWTRSDGRPLPEGRHSISEGNLTITDVSEEDRGVYSCVARNAAAAAAAATQLLIENVPPRAPQRLRAHAHTNTVKLTWTPGHSGMEVDYHVWYRERSSSEWRTMKILSRDVTEATLVGLRPNTEYEVRVLSQDHLGDGLFSKPIFVTTLDEELSDNGDSYAAAAVTESPGSSTLAVSVRLIDDGALLKWERDDSDESACTVRAYKMPEGHLVSTKHTNNNYMLLPGLEEGSRYELSVECGSSSGLAVMTVPEFNRLRAVAAGCAIAALLLAALAVAIYFARDRICGRRTRTR